MPRGPWIHPSDVCASEVPASGGFCDPVSSTHTLGRAGERDTLARSRTRGKGPRPAQRAAGGPRGHRREAEPTRGKRRALLLLFPPPCVQASHKKVIQAHFQRRRKHRGKKKQKTTIFLNRENSVWFGPQRTVGALCPGPLAEKPAARMVNTLLMKRMFWAADSLAVSNGQGASRSVLSSGTGDPSSKETNPAVARPALAGPGGRRRWVNPPRAQARASSGLSRWHVAPGLLAPPASAPQGAPG